MTNKAQNKPQLDIPSLYDVRGKVCVVTGGATGIGKMFAAAFVQNGAKVYIASRKAKPLQEAAHELNSWGPGSVVAIPADVSSRAGCQALCDEIKKRETKVHVLVNNSGVSWGASLLDFPEKEGWDNLMALNVKSLFYMTTGLLPLLQKDADNVNPGRVINISSVMGDMPSAESPLSPPGSGTYSYSASKAAASHLTRVMAHSLAQKFVTVNAIAPGVFPSKMTAFGISKHEDKLVSQQPTGRVGTSEDMGGLALFLASRASAHITGAVIPIDGGAALGTFSKL